VVVTRLRAGDGQRLAGVVGQKQQVRRAGRLKISRGPTACPLQFASTGVKEQSSALFLVPSADQAH